MSATGRKLGVPNWTAAEIDAMMNAVGSIKPITTSQWDQAWSVFCASFPSTPRTAASMQEKFRLLSKAGDPRAVQAYAPPPQAAAAAADEPEPKRARLLEEIGALRAEQREMKAMVLAILDTTRIISFQLTQTQRG
jgi:hypothetical protein